MSCDEAFQYCHRNVSDMCGRRSFMSLRRFFTINFDTCHFSVLFQDMARSLRRLRRAGIQVGKLHVTSAVRLSNPYRSIGPI